MLFLYRKSTSSSESTASEELPTSPVRDNNQLVTSPPYAKRPVNIYASSNNGAPHVTQSKPPYSIPRYAPDFATRRRSNPRFEPETPGTDENSPLVAACGTTALSSPPGGEESDKLLNR